MKLDPFPGELQRPFVDRPYVTKTGRQGCQRVQKVVLTQEQEAWLRKWFPEEENSRLMKASGLSHSTLHRLARKLGLTKSEAGHHRIMLRQGQKSKRTCEKNGYYDSIRGRQVSDACKEGRRKAWQDVRDGKRLHPLAKMKAEHPRKYRNHLKRKSEARRELIRKEKLRDLYGLERKTRLRICHSKMTTRQKNHRHNAVKKYGYIVLDLQHPDAEPTDWRLIYYDHQTLRAPKFERNLLNDGFKVQAWREQRPTPCPSLNGGE